jgi:hypothetical protein
MVTSKEEPSVEISSTFDMTNNLDFKKNISNMAKSFLQVSIGYRNRNSKRFPSKPRYKKLPL